MGWRLVIVVALVACGSNKATETPPPDVAACLANDAKACFRAGYYYQRIDGDNKLDRAIDMWKNGCEHGDGMCCGQLGIIVEHGMSGRKANPKVAMSFYARACRGGDKDSCKRVGIEVPEKPVALDWSTVLGEVITDAREPGPLFAGYTLGQAFSPDVQARIDAWEKKNHARVHADVRDPTTRGNGSTLSIYFDRPEGFMKAFVAKFGKPEASTGAWTDPEHHRLVYSYNDERVASLVWAPYKSIDEQVLPDDKTRIGLEPIPLIGATIEAVQAALPDRKVMRDGENDWSIYDYGTGPITIRLETKRESVIVRARFEVLTNHPRQTAAFVEAMTKKLGAPTTTKTSLVWKSGKRRYSIETPRPNSGNIDLTIEQVLPDRWGSSVPKREHPDGTRVE